MSIRDTAGNALPGGQGGQMIGFIEPPAPEEVLPLKAYNFLIEPIRLADLNEGALFVKRFIDGYQQVWTEQQAAIFSIRDLWSITKVANGYLQYLKWIVGWTKQLDHITNQLDAPTLRRLIANSVALWKSRGPEDAIINILRLVTTARLRLWNWFQFRWVTDETELGEEHEGRDAWMISLPGPPDFDEYRSNLRIVDDGTLNRALVEDLVKLMRASGERIEISYIDFLDLFQTDEDNSQWLALDGSPLTVANGRLSLADDTKDERAITSAPGSADWTNYVATWRIRGTSEQGAIFYYQDDQNYYAVDMFLGPGAGAGVVALFKVVGGSYVELTTAGFTPHGTLFQNVWYALRVHVGPDGSGTRIRVYLDTILMVDYLDNSSPYTKGNLGFWHFAGTTAELDEVEMFQLPLETTLIDINS